MTGKKFKVYKYLYENINFLYVIFLDKYMSSLNINYVENVNIGVTPRYKNTTSLWSPQA